MAQDYQADSLTLETPVRVIDRDGVDLGLMIVARAQKIALDQGAELFVTEPKASPPVVRVVIVRKLADLIAAEIWRYDQG